MRDLESIINANKAYVQGCLDFANGKTLDQNPYPQVRNTEYNSWRDGWWVSEKKKIIRTLQENTDYLWNLFRSVGDTYLALGAVDGGSIPSAPSYQYGVAYNKNWTNLNGFSEGVFSFIRQYEVDLSRFE